MKRAPWTGLVLSGGGARGAYEAGVIKYIRDELPAKISSHIRFEIICGTSVGAINSCFLASYNHIPSLQGKTLMDVWRRIHIEDIYHFSWREFSNLPQFLLGTKGRGQIDQLIGPGRLGGLFNTSPLEKLVHHTIRWNNIDANIKNGDLKALAINAAHLDSGKTHVFVQNDTKKLPPWSTDPQIEAKAVTIKPEHALASAAIPWVFPAVNIDGHVYCDGGLKLNTPISPALRLGADRILVIGLRHQENKKIKEMADMKIDSYPSASYLLGKILNALLLDKTDYDLARLERFNAMIESGGEEFGDRHHQMLQKLMKNKRGAPYRKIDSLVIRPGEDIAKIASKHLHSGTILSRVSGLSGWLFKKMASVTKEDEASDLLSYLLFDSEYAENLMALGMQDADAKRQEIIDFFKL